MGAMQEQKRSTARRALVAVAGGTLLAAGVVAVPLPIAPGWALVGAGLAVLATEFAWARRPVSWMRRAARRSSGRGGDSPGRG